jgi:two-component system sensor histidine kinase HydH
MVVVIRVFPFFLLTMAGGILLLLFMSKEISRSADALGAEMDSLASNSQKGLGDVLVDYNYPVEFLSLFHRFADMSDRIQNLTDEFARSARLAAFGELATVIVHDIKNPLFIISATAQSGEWTTIEDEVNRTKFNKIVTATQEIDHYLKKILSIARTTPDQDRPVYIPDLFRRVLHLWEPVLARKGIELETDIDEMLPRVKGDIGNLQQVMLNLLINAVEAMPDGGVISLAATKCQNSIEISVSDTGHGIPEEVQPKIFKRFFTTKDQGTGVGLASGYAMITKLGGKMWFKSSEGKGTTFYIQLPIYDSPIDM